MEIKRLKGNFTSQVLEKASATVIAANSWVALDGSKLAIPAVAASIKLAYTRSGAAAGDLKVEASTTNDFTVKTTANANFAESNRGTLCDITDAQLTDLGTSSTNVLEVMPSEDAGVVGSAANVEVRIADGKHL